MLVALDAAALRRWSSAAVAELGAHRDEIDELNVYPVPDGDTGSNLLLTMQAAVDLLRRERPVDLAQTAAVLARGALLGARGNSGVLLSQLLAGLAQVVAGGSEADGRVLAAALQRGSMLLRSALAEPVEGTMLSVAAAAADAAATAAGQVGVDGLGEVVRAARAAAGEALRRTPTQLPALARAGVVDAGGRGLVAVLDALVSVVGAGPADEFAADPPGRPVRPNPAPQRLREIGSVLYAYEVQYLLESDSDAVTALGETLAGLGDSLAVVGDGTSGGGGVWKVHVHVNDVGAAIEAGVHAGRPSQISVIRFADEVAAAAGPALRGVAVVAVTAGAGLARLFESEGSAVVPGGAARRPSTADLLAAIRLTGAEHVVVLPNDPDCTAVADAAAAQARAGGQDVAVVPTRSPVQGLAAVAVHDPERRFGDDVIAMAEVASATRWAGVSVAQREAQTMAGRCVAGDCLGLVEGEVVLIGATVPRVATELVDRLLLTGGELITLVLGDDAAAELGRDVAEHISVGHPEIEVVVYAGGQPDYPLLLGVE